MAENQVLTVKGVHPPKTRLGLSKMFTLLEAAEKLFTQSSFFEVSVSDICKEAHTAVGTFYIYFDSKNDVYRYLVERYKRQIKQLLADAIRGCRTRQEMEREGIKAFVCYSVANPMVYNIIWGSLAVEKQMFVDYYVSFAESYARGLAKFIGDLRTEDVTTLAYMLMGITNFLGLHAQFAELSDSQIDQLVNDTVMPVLEKGLFK